MSRNFFKIDQSRPLLIYFRLFSMTIDHKWKKHWWCVWDSKPDCRMKGADESTELWLPPTTRSLKRQKQRKRGQECPILTFVSIYAVDCRCGFCGLNEMLMTNTYGSLHPLFGGFCLALKRHKNWITILGSVTLIGRKLT